LSLTPPPDGDFDHHNRLGQANEPQKGRRHFCDNQSDRSVRREEIIGAELKLSHYRILTAFARTDSLILGKELEVKTEVSIEYCVV